MSAPKGYTNQTKLDRLRPQFATVEPIRLQQHGLTSIVHQFVRVVAADSVDSATQSVITAASHLAQTGDVIQFTSGALSGTEVKVDSVTTNTITLAEDLVSAPLAAVTFNILRHKYPVVDANGNLNISASVSSGPVQFVRDGIDTDVSEDTVTVGNSRPLPVKLLSNQVIPLPTGAATEATLAKLTQAQGSTTSGQEGPLIQAAVTTTQPTYTTAQTRPLSINTRGSLRTKSTGYDAAQIIRNAYGTTPVTTAAYVQLVASTANDINKLHIFDSSGQDLVLAVGPAASEVDQIQIFPGGIEAELFIPAGSRISVKAVSATANAGILAITGLR